MATITQIKKKVDVARKGIPQATDKIIKDNEQLIVDLVRKNQLFENGINGLGQNIGVYKYDYDTSDTFVQQLGAFDPIGFPKKAGEPYNFYWSNGTYKGFTVKYANFELIIFSTDNKFGELVSAYGKEIFWMTDENQIILSETIIRPGLLNYLKTIFK